MAKSPKVTIIIPVYNVEPYLRECLDSVFSQTYQNINVICVNDGSTDGSGNILKDYASEHANLVLIEKPNGGLSSARNAGLNQVDFSNHDYLFFLDSDDKLAHNYIERLVKEALSTAADIVCSSFSFYDGERARAFKGVDSVFGTYEAFTATALLVEDRTIQSHVPSKLFRANLWEQHRFNVEQSFMEDQAMTFKLFAASNKTVFLQEYGYFYRTRPGSLVGSAMTNRKALNALSAYFEVLDYPYTAFTESQQKQLRAVASDALARCALMVLPRFDKKTASEKEKDEHQYYCRRILSERIVRKFVPKTATERLKKLVFICARPLYSSLFRLVKKI